ncbi:PAS domain S-box-containing protein [Novosphingobium sp. PhB57]|uniref:sensor histidine kinase n=1 Tax=Novosphingobium sp. PhB57 TaxID=2485107 RepID=UPI0010D01AA5|nr:HWE histidine kinase domain-containing protein [Novosphingobium sp. PhB57]TCU51848.1 PAS domain S-box-containing protein [Novosphingobium sp. PhB57]
MAPGKIREQNLESQRLLDENEQLRTALESSLDENTQITEDRDRLLRRVAVLARELQAANSAYARVREAVVAPPTDTEEELRRSQTEEELRVAFEELQVLTEELEVANAGLHTVNSELESRVAERTRDLMEANAALRRSESRLNTLIEGMPQLVWRAVDGGEWVWASPQWWEYTGQTDEQSRGIGWLDAFHPSDRDAARAAWDIAATEGRFDFKGRICHAGEHRYRHFRTRASPVRAADGIIVEWLGTSTDIDDLIRLQEQQSVLVAELQHRTRNLMAVVQAVMSRTIKGSRSLEDFRRCISDRLEALARVQGLLSRRDLGTRVSFDALLHDELSAHLELDAQGNAAQVSTEGPAGVPLQSSLVQTLALAIHELMTNAVKYGALASEAGHLTVRWEEVQRDERPRLLIDWRETGVTDIPAPDSPPQGSGYGRELIERALPYQLGARTSYAFTADGIHCTIEVDAPSDRALEETVHGSQGFSRPPYTGGRG